MADIRSGSAPHLKCGIGDVVFLRAHETRRVPSVRSYDPIVGEIVGNVGGVRPDHEQLRIPIGNDLEDQVPEMRLAPSVDIRFEDYLVSAPIGRREMGHFHMGGRSRKNAADALG
jgi:hypothetical protein